MKIVAVIDKVNVIEDNLVLTFVFQPETGHGWEASLNVMFQQLKGKSNAELIEFARKFCEDQVTQRKETLDAVDGSWNWKKATVLQDKSFTFTV